MGVGMDRVSVRVVAAGSEAARAFADDCMFRALLLMVESVGGGGGGGGGIRPEVRACSLDEIKAAAFAADGGTRERAGYAGEERRRELHLVAASHAEQPQGRQTSLG